MKQDIKDRLSEARRNAGFKTPTDAARHFGWTLPTYLAHENGTRGVKADAIRRYANAFKVDFMWLYTGESEESSLYKDFNEIDWQAFWLINDTVEGFIKKNKLKIKEDTKRKLIEAAYKREMEIRAEKQGEYQFEEKSFTRDIEFFLDIANQ